MKIETIRKSHKKKVIIGIVAFIVIAIVFIVGQSFAKYSLVKSIKIAEGTINYKIPDFKIMAMYQQKANQTCTNDSCYEEITSKRMPTSGYVINESKSYCTLDNINKKKNARLYTNENGEHIISNLAKSSKCYLYFDREPKASEKILKNITVKSGTPDFNKTAQITCSDATTCETTNGVYKAKDDDGDTYYFRGYVENNYVRFAGYWWRIIRINGDGSIRIIYDGTSKRKNGTVESNNSAINAAFNYCAGNCHNYMIGFKYSIYGENHGLNTKSNALTELEKWYNNNLINFVDKIDINAGFCGDRTISTESSSYGGLIRLVNSTKSPVLTCANKNDLYTLTTSNKGNKSLDYPIGLITADEISMAGGLYNTTNTSFYLYNGLGFWSITPFNHGTYTNVFTYNNTLTGIYVTNTYTYLRPVINLKSNIKITGNGTADNPFVIQ